MKKRVERKKYHLMLVVAGLKECVTPAVSLVLEIRKRSSEISFTWVGCSRKEELEVCKKYNIPYMLLESQGNGKKSKLGSLVRFCAEFIRFNKKMSENKPSAVLAFGGYESIPVLAAARVKSVTYYLIEPNAIADPVNRLFASKAKRIFLGHSSVNLNVLGGSKELTGIPVRQVSKGYNKTEYPGNFDRSKKTILICSGKDDSYSFNCCLVDTVKEWLENGVQIIWQTGGKSYPKLKEMFSGYNNIFLFSEVKDLYPYYAASKIVVGRSEPDFMAEIAYFGLPCMLISPPPSTNSIKWLNAGLVQNQGWAIRFQESESCGEKLLTTVNEILADEDRYEWMCRKALDNAPTNAVSRISEVIINELGIKKR